MAVRADPTLVNQVGQSPCFSVYLLSSVNMAVFHPLCRFVCMFVPVCVCIYCSSSAWQSLYFSPPFSSSSSSSTCVRVSQLYSISHLDNLSMHNEFELFSYHFQGNTTVGGIPQSSVNGRLLLTSQLALQSNLAKNPEKILAQQARFVAYLKYFQLIFLSYAIYCILLYSEIHILP